MGTDSIERIQLEVASISGEIRRTVDALISRADTLEGLGRTAYQAAADAKPHDPADELRDRAVALRSVVTHGLTVLAEVQSQAGRLETLAWVRQLARAVDATARDDEGG